MAREVIEQVTCDLCGREVGQTGGTSVVGLDGNEWELDLCEDHFPEVTEQVAGWGERGRRLGGGRGRRTSPGTRRRSRQKAPAVAAAREAPSPAEVRAWAREHGLEVPTRGRIPEAVRQAYEEANG